MKFSLFYEMQISDPTPETEVELFHACVRQAELADELGYHCIWAVEHHGLREYSHSSAPEIFLATVAARTKRIRVGHGIALTPHRYNHPLRVAERVAALDIFSNGRVNLGTGKSLSPTEQGCFNVDQKALHGEWLEALEIIPRAWQDEVFSFKGKHYDIPPTQIVPKPVQKPHPPMFSACSKPEAAHHVGALGLGALNLALGTDKSLHDKVKAYKAAVAAATPKAYAKNDWFCSTPPCLVLDDDFKATQVGLRGANFFTQSLSRYYYGGDRPLGRLDISRDDIADEDVRAAMDFRGKPGSPNNIIVGDSNFAREQVQRFVDAGVDELICVMQMGTVPNELVYESIKTFGEKVIPHFS